MLSPSAALASLYCLRRAAAPPPPPPAAAAALPQDGCADWRTLYGGAGGAGGGAPVAAAASAFAVARTPEAAARRAAALQRYRGKRATRSFAKTIRYASRARYADERPRVSGRFAKPQAHAPPVLPAAEPPQRSHEARSGQEEGVATLLMALPASPRHHHRDATLSPDPASPSFKRRAAAALPSPARSALCESAGRRDSGGAGGGSDDDAAQPAQLAEPAERRAAALQRFQAKRATRCFGKHIRYADRKQAADARPRKHGRFVRPASDDDEEEDEPEEEVAALAPGQPDAAPAAARVKLE
jgi:hypothetical protein